MFKSYDIALSLQYGKLHATNRKGKVVSKALPTDADYLVTESSKTSIIDEIKAVYKALLTWGGVSPKVFATSPSGFESDRMLLKRTLIHAGAREVLLLDRAMSVLIGHYNAALAERKATVVLVEPNSIEVASIDQYSSPRSWSCHPELIQNVLWDAEKKCHHTSSELSDFSSSSYEKMGEVLGKLRRDGFMADGILLWSPERVPEGVMDVLDAVGEKVTLAEPSAMLDGCRLVMDDLKLFLTNPK